MSNRICFIMDNLSIKKKLWLIYLLGIMIPMIALFGFFIYQITSEFDQHQDMQIKEGLKRIEQSLITILDSSEKITYTYLGSKSINNQLKTNYSLNKFEGISALQQIEDQIKADLYTYTYFESIRIYHKNEGLPPSDVLVPITTLESDIKIQNFLESSENFLLSKYVDSQSQPKIRAYRKLNAFDLYSKNIMVVEFNTLQIIDKLTDATLDEFHGEVDLVNSNEEIFFGTSSKMHMDDQIFIRIPFSYREYFEGYSLRLTLPKSALEFLPINLIIRIILAGLLIVSIASLLTYIVGYSISHRLFLINQVMAESENDNLIKIQDYLGKDEIGNTAHHYNQVVDYVKNLLQVVESDKNHISELLTEKISAYQELESINEEMAAVNEELTSSYEEIRIQDNQIQNLIFTDQLTQLKNRYAINQVIDNTIRLLVSNELVAILFIDVDNFKYINDLYGHDMGDRIIGEMGKRLITVESPQVSMGRFGGDEFLLLIRSNTGKEEINRHIMNIHELFSKPLTIDGFHFYLTTSIGYAFYPEHGITREVLVKNADQAMYAAKASGRNKCVLFEPSMNESLKDKINLQGIIIEAFKKKEFYLVYQPFIDASSLEVIGFEALIRWNTVEFRHISPFKLISIAEETGLIVELGDWIFKEACLFAKKINQNRVNPLMVSVNVSAVQLKEVSINKKFQDIIYSVGIPASYMFLEMTETYLISTIEYDLSIIDELKEGGFNIVLDDFGTGYSSLNYFKELPIAILKIDKTFIDNIVTNKHNADIVDIMITLAHKKGVTVIAEGVEDDEQFQYLLRNGCDTIQGFLFSRPLKEKEAICYLDDNSLRVN